MDSFHDLRSCSSLRIASIMNYRGVGSKTINPGLVKRGGVTTGKAVAEVKGSEMKQEDLYFCAI